MIAQGTELKLCFVGASTDHPCRWPATVETDRFPEGHKVCRFHAADMALWGEVDSLNLAVALIEDEFEPRARQYGNGPLLKLFEWAKVDYSERADLLDRHLREAEVAATAPQQSQD